MNKQLQKRRKLKNDLFNVFCILAVAFVVSVIISILYTLISKGLPGLSWKVFTQITPAAGQPGGLLNAIVGSLIISALAIALAAPIGVLIATYLAEFGNGSKLGTMIRFFNDILLSTPSIIVGLFVYAIVVVPMGHFSAIAGAISLMIIALPIIVRTTEDIMKLVPDQMREAAIALGIPRWIVIVKIIYRIISRGLITGIFLALARIMGETAPLLFTALNNQFWSLNLNKPMANLPIVIFQYAMSPYAEWQRLAWTGALLITAAILTINIIARITNRSGETD